MPHFDLHLTQYNNGEKRYVLWLIQADSEHFLSWDRTIRIKNYWVEWVESFAFKGKVSREYYVQNSGDRTLRNIMVFSDLSDVMMVKLAFHPNMFDHIG